MLRGDFRPWGPLRWLLSKLTATRWDLLGCLATEERALAAWTFLKSHGSIKHVKLLEVHDEHPQDSPHTRFFDGTERKLREKRDAFLAGGGSVADLETCYLGDIYGRFVDATDEFLKFAGKNVIIDISSLPKRVFFPAIRRVLQSREVRNIIVTYTIPAKYADDELVEDPQLWTYLPTFAPPDDEPDDKLLIVGLGYEPLGIRHASEGKGLHLLFPFPSLPPGIRRNWDFVYELRGNPSPPIQRVHIYDVPETFDRIRTITKRGGQYAILAPYGPKPVSLAMCLYAVAAGEATKPPSVFYTQPRAYNPDYSSGVAEEDGHPCTMGYCLRIQGRDLYRM